MRRINENQKASRKMCRNTDRMTYSLSKSTLLQVLSTLCYSLLSVSLGGANDTSVHLPTFSDVLENHCNSLGIRNYLSVVV